MRPRRRKREGRRWRHPELGEESEMAWTSLGVCRSLMQLGMQQLNSCNERGPSATAHSTLCRYLLSWFKSGYSRSSSLFSLSFFLRAYFITPGSLELLFIVRMLNTCICQDEIHSNTHPFALSSSKWSWNNVTRAHTIFLSIKLQLSKFKRMLLWKTQGITWPLVTSRQNVNWRLGMCLCEKSASLTKHLKCIMWQMCLTQVAFYSLSQLLYYSLPVE